MKYFLVDFENVHSKGMTGHEALDAEDRVVVFYTESNMYINMDMISGHSGQIEFRKVPCGDQSLDKLLICRMGVLAARSAEDDKIVVISHDQGYSDCIRSLNAVWPGKAHLTDSIGAWFGRHAASPVLTPVVFESKCEVPLAAEKARITGLIGQILQDHGMRVYAGGYGITLAELCNHLNADPVYRAALKRSGSKPAAFLERFFTNEVDNRVQEFQNSLWFFQDDLSIAM